MINSDFDYLTNRLEIDLKRQNQLKHFFDVAKFHISIRYWTYSQYLRFFWNHIQLSSKSTFFFHFENELIIWSENFRVFFFSSKDIAIIFLAREFFENTFNCLANWSFFSTSAMTSIFDRLEIFNSAFSYDWFEDELFNQIADFLQHLQQCLHLYCESELLDLLIIALVDFVNAWFDDQSKFIFLREFDIVLTSAFSSFIFSTLFSSSLSISASESICEIFEKSTNSCSSSQKRVMNACKQQELKIKFEVSKFKKVSKAKQTVKSTSTLQNIDIFDSTTCNESEFELYSEVAKFLQHLQQRRHQYRKSDLLKLLSKCLCDLASEWFKTQFEFISLKRFNRVLAKAFSSAETSLRRVSSRSSNLQLCTLVAISKSMKNASNQQVVQMICKICKQSFNFNKKLYEHIRNHEALKLVKNSSLSINAVNLVCEIEKKSFVTHVSSASSARSQNSIFESATAFKSVILLKRSIFSSFTLETVSKSMKNTSMQCLIDSSSSHVSQISAQKHQHMNVQKHSTVSSSLSIDTVKSIREILKKTTIINSLTSLKASIASETSTKQIFEFAIFFETINSLKRSNSSLFTFNIVSIRMKNESLQCSFISSQNSIQDDVEIDTQKSSTISSSLLISTTNFTYKITKRSTTCRHCKQTFKFKEFLRKHKREQHAKKSVINSSFRSHAFKSVCKTEKKSTIKNVTTLSALQELQISDQKVDDQKHSIVNSLLLIDTVKSTCKVAKKSTTVSIAKFSKFISEERAESRTRTAYLFARLKASRLNLSLNTFVIISETMKNASIQEVACARTMCKSCKQNFNFNKKLFEHISEHEVLKRINIIIVTFSQSVSSRCSSLQLRALNFASKSKESISIQRITCVRTICKRCNQIFNFNNKFHEHIRQHHVRKSVISKNSDFRVLALKSTYKIAKKSAMTFSSVSHASSIFSATSRSQIFSTKMSSRSVSHKDSHLSIAKLKITSKSMKKLSINCSFTFSLSSFWTSVRNFHEFHIRKSHLIMNNLNRMFHEKFKSFDLRQHHNSRSSSQSFDIRQFHSSSFSIKSYLIIENLFEIFDEKLKKKSLFQNQKNVSFRTFFSNQSRITIYFKFTVN